MTDCNRKPYILDFRCNANYFIPRTGDFFTIDKILIPSNVDIKDLDDFSIYFNEVPIFTLPFNIWLFSRVDIQEKYITLYFPDNVLQDKKNKNNVWPSISIPYTNITIFVNARKDFSCKLFITYISYNSIDSSIFKDRCIPIVNILKQNTKNNHILSLYKNIHGLYIKTCEPLKRLRLDFGNDVTIDYSGDTPDLYLKKMDYRILGQKYANASICSPYDKLKEISKIVNMDVFDVICGYIDKTYIDVFLYYLHIDKSKMMHNNKKAATLLIELEPRKEKIDQSTDTYDYIEIYQEYMNTLCIGQGCATLDKYIQ